MKKLFTFLSALLIVSYLSFGQWSTDPLENNAMALASGEEAIPKIATSIYGTTYIAWFSSVGGSYNTRLQKVDVFGNKLWPDDGLLVSGHPSMGWLTDWDITVDGEECAILTFQDIRNNGNNDVFAYRISPDGEFLWGDDGIELSNSPAFDASPKCCATNAGNAVFAWQVEDVIILQKISPGGNKLWGDAGITLSGANTFSWPQLLPVGNDDVILKFFEDIGPFNAPARSVYAQRYDTDGNEVWGNPAIISNAPGISAWTQIFSFINDGTDGFFIAWHDDRDQNNLYSVFVQHVGADGTILLGDDGTEASTLQGRHNFYPYLSLPTGSSDIFVFWNEMDGDQDNRGIYGQKISVTGERLWGDNGKVFIEISPTNVYPFAASQTGENPILFYEKYTNTLNAGINAMMIDADGEFVWPGQMVELCAVQSEKVHSVAGDFNYDQWILAWEDSRNGGRDIYAQNIQVDGSLGPVVIPTNIEVYPDTMFFEENPQTIPCKIYNNTNNIYTITEIDEIGNYWWILYPLPALPYEIIPGDSLIFDVEFQFITKKQTDGYEIDYLNIYTEVDTHSVVIAINEDLLVGLTNHLDDNIMMDVYPNPATNSVSFDLTVTSFSEGEINILNTNGEIVITIGINDQDQIIWDLKNKAGQKVSPGNYYYQIITDKEILSGKLWIME